MNLYFIGRGIVLKGIVKYYGSGKNIPRTFGCTGLYSRKGLRMLLPKQYISVVFSSLNP
jgi:hypothetical protein